VSDNGMSAGPRPDDRGIVLFGGTGDLARLRAAAFVRNGETR
jgi:hypothetical protein